MTLHEQLKHMRESQRLSQHALAQMAGTTQSNISLLEAGKTKRRFSIELTERVANELGFGLTLAPVDRPPKRT